MLSTFLLCTFPRISTSGRCRPAAGLSPDPPAAGLSPGPAACPDPRPAAVARPLACRPILRPLACRPARLLAPIHVRPLSPGRWPFARSSGCWPVARPGCLPRSTSGRWPVARSGRLPRSTSGRWGLADDKKNGRSSEDRPEQSRCLFTYLAGGNKCLKPLDNSVRMD
jgi:hypothetical protein